MYTANTMASAAEALGMTLPGSSSFPAEYPEKLAECDAAGATMRLLLEKNILPRDIMTRSAFENAMVRAPPPPYPYPYPYPARPALSPRTRAPRLIFFSPLSVRD